MKYYFVQSSKFQKVRDGLLGGDDGYRDLQNALLESPHVGDVIQGTGGVRKARFASPLMARGKSGGIRIVYAFIETQSKILLMRAYAKNAQANLTQTEIRELRQELENETA